MKSLTLAILVLAVPLFSVAAEKPDDTSATDRLPQPHYHRQPSDPAWLAGVVQFHGHLGPSVDAGARMGMIGLRAVECEVRRHAGGLVARQPVGRGTGRTI